MIHLEPWEFSALMISAVVAGGYVVWNLWADALHDYKAERKKITTR